MPLPANRDSTDYTTMSVPGVFSGHELFQDVAVPGQRDQSAGPSEWMIAVYNSGIEVWSLDDPGQPTLDEQRDGWFDGAGPNQWRAFVAFGEEDTFVKSVDVLQVDTTIYIGVSARLGVGFTAWIFETSDGSLTQIYQDLNAASLDVSLIQAPSGRVHAFAASLGLAASDGVRAYDLSAAAELETEEACLDTLGSNPCGVFQGLVGTIPRLSFVSAMVVDGTTYLAASDGNAINDPMTLELWEIGDPNDPRGTSELRFAGLGSHIHSPQLFTYEGHHYVAVVDKSEGLDIGGQMRIYDVGHCLDADGCSARASNGCGTCTGSPRPSPPTPSPS